MSTPQRVRKSPRITANALTEYMFATASQRQKILHDQKYPTDYRPGWYREATKAMVRCLLDPGRDRDPIISLIDRLEATQGQTPNEKQRIANNVAALQAFLGCVDDAGCDELRSRRGSNYNASLPINGVKVSIRPEVLLVGKYRGTKVRGGLKLYLAKNDRLNDESGAVVATLVHTLASGSLKEGERCHQRHCQVLDVFGSEWYPAPTAVVRRRRDIEAACREIAERWANI